MCFGSTTEPLVNCSSLSAAFRVEESGRISLRQTLEDIFQGGVVFPGWSALTSNLGYLGTSQGLRSLRPKQAIWGFIPLKNQFWVALGISKRLWLNNINLVKDHLKSFSKINERRLLFKRLNKPVCLPKSPGGSKLRVEMAQPFPLALDLKQVKQVAGHFTTCACSGNRSRAPKS